MAEQHSAVQGQLIQGTYGILDEIGVALEEVRPLRLIQVAAWPETVQEVGKTIAKSFGVDKAPAPGQAKINAHGAILRTEPLKWWIIGPQIQPLALKMDQGATLDLSHSRLVLLLTGEKAAQLLNHFLPINLSANVFGNEAVASSAFHHVGVTLWRHGDDGFYIALPRSFAASLTKILIQSAHQYGLEIR